MLTVTQQQQQQCQQLSHFPYSHFNLKIKLLFAEISRKSVLFRQPHFFQFFALVVVVVDAVVVVVVVVNETFTFPQFFSLSTTFPIN